ncbi:sensor histidine kinase [Crassaminicella thermophila]|uniref:histidine kinase n=1 Tax=Crassaminicella thermophila TaxID=2599308 RepID=A0A5C0SGG3_CRATE|nr:ATP-binding protein [Crassaminicella thermophila]QEK12318.1 sensor histidine kinase [Crassaminicella thermophila]
MKELSLHILDIVQNSITAKATFIQIIIEENEKENFINIKIIDNGIGMNKDLLEKVINPFVTTRKTRKVGLGISLFKAAAERCNGRFYIQSELGKGTEIFASFERDHIDRAPLGNMVDTIITIIMANEKIDYVYKHTFNECEFIFDTREIRKVLGGMPLNDVAVIDWMKNYIIDGIKELYKNKEIKNQPK